MKSFPLQPAKQCRHHLFILFFVLIFSGMLQAQTQVTGSVLSDVGTAIPNVSVQIKGGSGGTSTDSSGFFSITTPGANDTLVFTSVGYEEKEEPVNGRTELAVSLTASTQSMEQVVVVGYGTSRRRDLTGAVASVKGEELAKQPVQTPTQALQGKVSGVQVIASGRPNAAPRLRIRGTGSTLGGVEPLYVVDGVITDDIRNINNSDIVTMEILKDASATAIYGMRATNGVVLITTKKGKKGKLQFNYDMNTGFREAANLVKMADENQYATYLNEASLEYTDGDTIVSASALTGNNTNWYDAILKKALQQNHNLSLSGGTDNVTYFLSAGYLTDGGIQKNNGFERFTLRSNNEYNLSKKLKLTTQVSFTNARDDGNNDGAFQSAYRAAPTVPGKLGGLYGNTSVAGNVANPLLSIEKTANLFITNRIQGTGGLEYKPVSWLTLKSAIGTDISFIKNTAYDFAYLSDESTFIIPGGNQQRARSQLSLEKNDLSRYVWDNTANFSKKFNKHNLTFLLGMTAEEFRANNQTARALDVPANRDQWFLNAGAPESQTVENTGDKWARNSYLSRLNYGFDDRYLLTASFRADGTSRFGENNRWGYFPSAGVAWNITREAFMSNQSVFDELKLRASWGRVGNDNIPTSLYYSLANTTRPYYFDGQRYSVITFDEITDRRVRWEITSETDLGIDFSVLNRRLTGQFDYYIKKTNDALTYVNIPGILGDEDNRYITNAATFENKGFELALNWNDKFGSDWNYSIGGNMGINRNTILNLNQGQALFDGNVNGFTTLSDNGNPIGSFYLLQMEGIFQSEEDIQTSAQPDAIPGDIRYKDVNGDNLIDDRDRTFSGSYLPKMTYGANINISNKNWDLSINTYGTHGSKIYNGKKALHGTDFRDNIEAATVENRWAAGNPNNTHPRATLGLMRPSNYFLESGNFFRINNVTIGYTLPQEIITKWGLSRVRVYLTSQNLFTFTRYSGFNPEIIGTAPLDTPLNAGIELNTYPTTRTFAFGLNIGF